MQRNSKTNILFNKTLHVLYVDAHTHTHKDFDMHVCMTCSVEFIKLFWHTNNTAKQKAKKNYNNDGVRAWRIIAYIHKCINT